MFGQNVFRQHPSIEFQGSPPVRIYQAVVEATQRREKCPSQNESLLSVMLSITPSSHSFRVDDNNMRRCTFPQNAQFGPLRRRPSRHSIPRTHSSRIRASGQTPACFEATEKRDSGTGHVLNSVGESLKALCTVTFATATAGLLFFSGPAMAEIQRFPASNNPEVFAVQKTLVEAWDVVDKVFVDETGDSWRQDLRTYLMEAYNAEDADTAYQSIEGMLKDLDDPYTRLVLPEYVPSGCLPSDQPIFGSKVVVFVETTPPSG